MLSDSEFQESEKGSTIGSGSGRLTFAFKLWEIANDGKLIKWNPAGDGVIVEQREYEENVHELYPRFVQNSSFLNLKRLFRDYGFQRHVLRRKSSFGWKVEYINPQFKRDNYENLINVTAKERIHKYKLKSTTGYVYRARRKYTRRFPRHQSILSSLGSSPSPNTTRVPVTPSSSVSVPVSPHGNLQCPPRKRGRPPTRMLRLSSCNSANSSFSDVADAVGSSSDQSHKLDDSDMFRLFQIFAKNELSEDMYFEAILRRFGHKLEHLRDKPFDDIAYAIHEMMDPSLSPIYYSESDYYEYSLDEL